MEEPKTWWKCSKCGHLINTVTPPDPCPSCNQQCSFLNVTCYTPECGRTCNIDPRLTGNKD